MRASASLGLLIPSLFATFFCDAGLAQNTMSAAPSSLSFSCNQPQQIQVSGSTTLPASISAEVIPPGIFVAVVDNSTKKVTVGFQSTPLTLPYSATLRVHAAGFSDLDVPLTLVSATSCGGGGGSTGLVTATPASVTLSAASGSSASLNVQLSSAAPGLAFTVTSTTTTGANWLSTSTSATTTPATLTVFGLAQSLTSGTYTGTITISAGGTTTTIPVSFIVGGGSSTGLNVSPGNLTFSTPTGSTALVSQQLSISSTVANVSFGLTASVNTGSGWLAVSPATGTLPATVTVYANPANLAAGNYSGTILIATSGGLTTSQLVPVTLTVGSGGPATVAAPTSLSFAVQSGSTFTTPAQALAVSGAPGSGFTISAVTVTGGAWLNVDTSNLTIGSTGFTSVPVSVNAAGLPAGLYTGTIAVGTSSGAQTVAVSLAVTGSPVLGYLLAAQQPIAFYPGNTGVVQTIYFVASDNSHIPFTVAPSAPWIVPTPAGGTTPATIAITISNQGLVAGLNVGSLAITGSFGNSPMPVPIVINAQTSGVSITPSSLTFTGTAGGTPPASQTLTLASPAAASFTAAASAPWLTVSPASGTAPGSVTVGVNPVSLAAGSYNGNITITDTGVTQTIPVTLTLTAAAGSITLSPSSLSFAYTLGGTAPSAQGIQVASNVSGTSFTATAGTQSGGTWLAVSPPTGTAPANLSVAVNTTGLTIGTYTGTITVTPAGGTGQTVAVTLTVTAPAPKLNSVTNAASFQAGAIAPGEVITLFGTALGPATPVTAVLDSAGRISSSIGNVRVLVGGIPSPMIYASDTQVSAIVPYESAGLANATVQVEYQGVQSNSMSVAMANTAPGLFTGNATGAGALVAINQDNTLNSAANPAAKGSVVVFYATGEGQTSPAGQTGKISSDQPFPRPVLPIAVLIDGQPADVLYAGAAPNFVAGLMQVNVRIPLAARSGAVPVLLSAGSNSSQSGVTIAVQ